MQAGQDDDPALEALLGYPLFAQGSSKLGWLMNLNEVHTSDFSHSGLHKLSPPQLALYKSVALVLIRPIHNIGFLLCASGSLHCCHDNCALDSYAPHPCNNVFVAKPALSLYKDWQ